MLDRAFRGDWPARVWGALPGTTRVRHIRHRIACLAPGSPDLRIGFISDIHIGPTTPLATIEAAFDLLRADAPDVLLLGGDYVFLAATEAKAQLLGELVDRVPTAIKLAVLGNHDLWDQHELLERALVSRGVRLLVNDAVELPAPHAGVVVVGLDDPWTGRPDADAAFATCPDDRVKIALCHAPEGGELVRGRGVSLLVCGHTHGGQVALPRPVYVHGPVGRRFWAGLHVVDDVTMFVSRGIGGIEIPVRIGAAPDVATFTFTARDR